MMFNSFVFPLFLLVVWTCYVCLTRRAQNVLLLVSSYVFYGWWDWRFLSLLALSTVCNYFCALFIERDNRKKNIYLIISLCVNLGMLCFFKYFHFFTDSFVDFLSIFGFYPTFGTLNIILPVGISFYTFQTIAYMADVYRGRQKATHDYLAFSIYVSYFPQLLAGPISRSTQLLPQIQNDRTVTHDQIYSGCQLIFMGYFKKIVIADGLVAPIGICFEAPHVMLGGVALYIGLWLLALQIYCDFSGYTDIARGVSRLFGIELLLNFRQPYLAPNITEFWRRWHISLSTWLRDYIYIPLGGNRRGATRSNINLMTTMLLGGLWHGASWTYVIWGGLHGVYLVIHRLILQGKKREHLMGHTIMSQLSYAMFVFLTFNLVCVAWLLFRAQSFSAVLNYLRWMCIPILGKIDHVGFYLVVYGGMCILIDIMCFAQNSDVPFPGKRPSNYVRGVVYAIMLFMILFIGDTIALPFIYFQF